jgi:hypothetical protein
MDIKIGFILTGLAAWEQAELYRWAMENISSNIFLYDLFKLLRNTFHSLSYSIMLAIRNGGIVLPMCQRPYLMKETAQQQLIKQAHCY